METIQFGNMRRRHYATKLSNHGFACFRQSNDRTYTIEEGYCDGFRMEEITYKEDLLSNGVGWDSIPNTIRKEIYKLWQKLVKTIHLSARIDEVEHGYFYIKGIGNCSIFQGSYDKQELLNIAAQRGIKIIEG